MPEKIGGYFVSSHNLLKGLPFEPALFYGPGNVSVVLKQKITDVFVVKCDQGFLVYLLPGNPFPIIRPMTIGRGAIEDCRQDMRSL